MLALLHFNRILPMTDLEQIISAIKKFTDDRQWAPYHKPKDLLLKMMEELGELAEHFEWKTDEEIKQYLQDEQNRQAVGEEAMDVLILLLLLADGCLHLDVEQAVRAKLKKNADKYPVGQDWKQAK